MSTQDSPVLNTERLVLAVPSGSAESAIFEIHSDARTYEHRPDLTMKTREEASALCNEWQHKWAEDGIGYFVVSRKDEKGADTGNVIGFCGVRKSVEKETNVLNVCYRFSPESQGKGFAKEATTAATEWAARNALICRLSQSSTRPILPQFGLQKSWDSRSMLAPECPETMTYTGFSPLPMSHLCITWAFG